MVRTVRSYLIAGCVLFSMPDVSFSMPLTSFDANDTSFQSTQNYYITILSQSHPGIGLMVLKYNNYNDITALSHNFIS